MIDGQRERARAARLGKGATDKGQTSRLALIGVSPDVITFLGVLLAVATGVVIAFGWFYVGIVLLVCGGLMDTLDGLVAKATGTSSVRGAFFDSVADRVADGFIFGGVAYYLLSRHDPRTALLPIAILVVSSVVSYERAKAESLGLNARGGLMERAERLILLGLALLLHMVLIPILAVLLGLTTLTAAGRFRRVWRQASAPDPARRIDARAARVEYRWKSRQEAGQARSLRRSRRQGQPLTTRLRGVLSAERPASQRHHGNVRSHTTRSRTTRALSRRISDAE